MEKTRAKRYNQSKYLIQASLETDRLRPPRNNGIHLYLLL